MIEAAVGDKSPNKPVDVIKIQDLLNNNLAFTEMKQLLDVNGTSSVAMVDAIKAFQVNHPGVKAKKPDGRVSANGNTLRRLNQCLNQADYHSTLPRGFDSNTLTQMNATAFVALYARQYPPLGASATLALQWLLEQMVADAELTDLRWAAYMLATVKHECANTWMPIEERGHGKGKDYGVAVDVQIDAKTKVSNIYYGRGFAQLTWEKGYKNMDKALGYSGNASLHLYPANALLPEVAYKVLSVGMRKGMYTGVGLDKYISASRADYLNARRVVNLLDRAALIKGYAVAIEFMLRFCNGVAVAK